MSNFGDRLKYLRKLKDMKQSDLGDLLGMSGSAIGTYERNVREPSLELIGKLTREFEVSADYLLGLTDDPKKGFKQDPKDLKEFLSENKVMFNGAELTKEEKQRAMDILYGLFYDSRK